MPGRGAPGTPPVGAPGAPGAPGLPPPSLRMNGLLPGRGLRDVNGLLPPVRGGLLVGAGVKVGTGAVPPGG